MEGAPAEGRTMRGNAPDRQADCALRPGAARVHALQLSNQMVLLRPFDELADIVRMNGIGEITVNAIKEGLGSRSAWIDSAATDGRSPNHLGRSGTSSWAFRAAVRSGPITRPPRIPGV